MATVWTVQADGSGDFPTVQAAVAGATDGDEVVLGPGTFTGPGNTDVSTMGKALTIRSSSGAPQNVIIDCQANSANPARGFTICMGVGSGTVIEGLTIINGFGYQAGIIAAGALLISNGSSPVVRNCIFENNHAGMSWDHAGGAVYVDGNSAGYFENCEFRGNSAYYGGAVGVNNFSTAEFVDCHFMGNAGGSGGAIWGNSTTKTRCLFARNTATQGGAIWGNGYNEELSISCTYYANGSTVGGAIYARPGYGSPVTLIDTVISDCPSGEAVRALAGVVVQASCSNLFGNAGGDWVGTLGPLYGMNGNFSENPCYCSPETDEFTLCADSYCLPDNHPWGCSQLVGAYGEGCAECSCPGPVPTRDMKWGDLRALYR